MRSSARALDASNYSLGTLQNAKWVASRIESSLRSELVGYKIHQEVASLAPAQQAKILTWAATRDDKGDLPTVREVRERVNATKRGISVQPVLPAGKYSLIYADPPWRSSQARPA